MVLFIINFTFPFISNISIDENIIYQFDSFLVHAKRNFTFANAWMCVNNEIYWWCVLPLLVLVDDGNKFESHPHYDDDSNDDDDDLDDGVDDLNDEGCD